MSPKFFGKYRGVVVNNIDPAQIGRIEAHVPDVFAADTNRWALPCALPNASKLVAIGLPKVGAAVWIEFERGDPDFPIWTGCYFGNASETPLSLRNT